MLTVYEGGWGQGLLGCVGADFVGGPLDQVTGHRLAHAPVLPPFLRHCGHGLQPHHGSLKDDDSYA